MTTAHSIVRSAAEILRPPRRMKVADAAAQYLHIYRPGGDSGLWNPALVPYMAEPMNRLADRSIDAVVFVGPARSGKTAALLLGWLSYIICCDPGDTLFLNTSEATARDFSKDDISRAHRYSPEIKARLSENAQHDNVFDKTYKHGMRLLIGWPSINQLSGRTLRYVAITDYDRMPLNIDGEGEAFTLASKRTQTFLSGGCVCVESSPGWLIEDAKWASDNPHEPPPCKGIFSLYAQSDRKRWYWPCPHCGEYFTAAPQPDIFTEIDGDAHLICPHCGTAIHRAHKKSMNAAGQWLAAGQTIDTSGLITGEVPQSRIAGYWLTGPAAAYQSWDSLLKKARDAQQILERTGGEEALQSVITGDYGTAYRPQRLHLQRDSRALQDRAELTQKRMIPQDVAFITAAVDIQSNRFVVQVVGWGKDQEKWIIDRYNIKWSPSRTDSNGELEPIDPAGYIEDWDILRTDVVEKAYPIIGFEGKSMTPVLTAIDSGGRAGVTERAYQFWRKARRDGFASRAILVKGRAGRSDAPRIEKVWPDSGNRRDRKANARGEIPVLLINTITLKDALAADLERTEAGAGYLHLPEWLGQWFFDELTAEVRTPKGWELQHGRRNEATDLMVYNHAAFLYLKGDKLNWERLPAWAQATQYTAAPKTSAAPKKPKEDRTKSSFINRPSGQSWVRPRR